MTETKPVIIVMKPKDRRKSKRDKLEIIGSAVGHEVDPIVDVNTYEAPIVVLELTEAQAKKLDQDADVKSVEPDMPMRAFGDLRMESVPDLSSETIPSGVTQIRAHLAWKVTHGPDIRVAVADTGIDERHPSLAPNMRPGKSFVPGDDSTRDKDGHGTHVAGTIGAAETGSGIVGVAPHCSLVPLKVLGDDGAGSFSWLIAAIDWAISNGVHVINMSLGASAAPTAVGQMCDLAWQRGLILVAAAGNSGGRVGYPAAFPNVIAVSAIDSAHRLASWSCRGPEVELCAPGVGVLSTLPDGQYGRMNGTSMACPHVAGAAALAISSHRWASNVMIRRALAQTAMDFGASGRDELFGYGMVNAERAASLLKQPGKIVGVP